MSEINSNTVCEMCKNQLKLTFHHLIPKSTHKNKWFRKNFSREEMLMRGIDICRQCHNFLHRSYSEKFLGRELNTLEAILNDEKIKKYVSWAKKH